MIGSCFDTINMEILQGVKNTIIYHGKLGVQTINNIKIYGIGWLGS